MRETDIITAEVSDMNLFGAGFAKVDGIALFIPGAVTDDVVYARITKLNRRFAEGEIIDILSPSPHRTKPKCPHFGKCGGCAFCHVKYSFEADVKRRSVEAAFRRGGAGLVSVPDIIFLTPERYRRKAVFHFDKSGSFGFFESGTKKVIQNFNTCMLCSETFDDIRNRFTEILQQENVPADAVKYMMIRTVQSGEVAVTAGKDCPSLRRALKRLYRETDRIVSVCAGTGDTPETGDCKIILGSDTITETMCGLRFSVAPQAFFQVNPPVADALIRKVSDMLAPPRGSLIADLYCGTGAVGLSVASMNPGARLRGIEINSSAVRCAKKNALANGIQNAEFFCADSSAAADILNEAPYAAIIDPPRSGASEKLISDLIALSPKKIAYISCNPSTLARDSAALQNGGYILREIHAADMFPRCAHVETAALFEKS